MKKLSLLLIIFNLLFSFAFGEVSKKVDKNGYGYQNLKGEYFDTRVYELKNGLKVYLSKNPSKPEISSVIAVKTGSKNDPKETTGLAHYLEHMMFKGTDKIGTLNWKEEKKLIKQISKLYEEHKLEKDEKKKKEIYKKIDALGKKASKYTVPSEYSYLAKEIGATGTNAYTSNDVTAYINSFPANELSRWNKLERERFGKLVLRLFPTELETVYEEFNRAQDNENRSVYETMFKELFKNHPYGEKTTIGEGKHLKNPSMVNIRKYHAKYYVPNNMAIILSGDLDYDKTIKEIDEIWGDLKPNKTLPKAKIDKASTINKIVRKTVTGPERERIHIAYQTEGANHEDRYYYTLIDMILNNSKAGLIDLNLVQNQKLQYAGSGSYFLRDLGLFQLYGYPKEGQSLKEVENLLLSQIELIKKGEFEDWILKAIINNYKLNKILSAKDNGRVNDYIDIFINDVDLEKYDNVIKRLEKIDKKALVEFANKKFKDNYLVIYKKQGKKMDKLKLEKPKITPLKINRENRSEFFNKFKNIKTEKIKPVFPNYNKDVKEEKLENGAKFSYIKNKDNEFFSLSYIYKLGSDNDKKMGLAISLLPYLGTDKYKKEDLAKEFYKLGIDYDVSISRDELIININGLTTSMDDGIKLVEHLLNGLKEDENALKQHISMILNNRKKAKLNHNTILSKLVSYATYGKDSRDRDIIDEKELKRINSKNLIEKIKNIKNYQHEVFYYGPKDLKEIKNYVSKLKLGNDKMLTPKTKKEYKELAMEKDKIYFAHYDMVQTKFMILSKGGKFDKELMLDSKLLNMFYGSGLSSIVFQEIREARGLAYTAYAAYGLSSHPDDSNYLTSFVGTQSDKLVTALKEMLNLLNNIPESEKSFQNSKRSLIKRFDSSRVLDVAIYNNKRYFDKMKIPYDYDKKLYEKIKNREFKDVKKFFNNHIKDKPRVIVIIGDKKSIDFKNLEKIAPVEELSLEELFGY